MVRLVTAACPVLGRHAPMKDISFETLNVTRTGVCLFDSDVKVGTWQLGALGRDNRMIIAMGFERDIVRSFTLSRGSVLFVVGQS